MGYLNRRMVLSNGVLFGSVNANRATTSRPPPPCRADRDWLTGSSPAARSIDRWHDAYERRSSDIEHDVAVREGRRGRTNG